MNKEKHTINTEEKQTVLNAKFADHLFAGKSFAENIKYALQVTQRTCYIDAVILKRQLPRKQRIISPKNEHSVCKSNREHFS